MIYTIGIKKIAIERLGEIIVGTAADALIDCRTRPAGVKGFSPHSLAEAFPGRYRYEGETLGSNPVPTRRTLERLAVQGRESMLILLCKEEAVGSCHLFHSIAKPLYLDHHFDCWHIFRDEIVQTSELYASIRANRPANMRPLGF